MRWLDAYVNPAIGDMQLADVQPGDVLKIIKGRAHTVVTAERIRVIIQQVYNHAIRNLLVTTNPAQPLRGAIARAPVEHHRHLNEKQLGAFWRKLDDQGAHVTTIAATRLLLFTMTRKVELANHRYVMVLHTHQANPHVHLSVRAAGRAGKRLSPRKEDLHRWREVFAEKLRDWGIEAEASSQATRGVSMRSLRAWERQPGAATHPGRRSEHKSGPTFRATRAGAMRAWSEISKALAASPEPADRRLSKTIVDFAMQTDVARAAQRHRNERGQAELPGMAVGPGQRPRRVRPEPSHGPELSR